MSWQANFISKSLFQQCRSNMCCRSLINHCLYMFAPTVFRFMYRLDPRIDLVLEEKNQSTLICLDLSNWFDWQMAITSFNSYFCRRGIGYVILVAFKVVLLLSLPFGSRPLGVFHRLTARKGVHQFRFFLSPMRTLKLSRISGNCPCKWFIK